MLQANPEKVMPEWEEKAATSCAAQNMMLMGHSMGAIGKLPGLPFTSWKNSF